MPASRVRAAIERRINRLMRVLGGPGWEKEWHIWSRYPLTRKPPRHFVGTDKLVDFCRGPAELADAILEKRPCRLSPELGWHVAELIERIQYPERFRDRHTLVSTFDPIQPLPVQF
jgi:hypothetical protein